MGTQNKLYSCTLSHKLLWYGTDLLDENTGNSFQYMTWSINYCIWPCFPILSMEHTSVGQSIQKCLRHKESCKPYTLQPTDHVSPHTLWMAWLFKEFWLCVWVLAHWWSRYLCLRDIYMERTMLLSNRKFSDGFIWIRRICVFLGRQCFNLRKNLVIGTTWNALTEKISG